MKKHLSRIIFTILCICLLPVVGMPCTTFVLNTNGQPVFAKNTEYMKGPAYIIVNKRGVAKVSAYTPLEPDAEHISWTSKYGSVTFNIFAREQPFEGINEAGFFITTLGGEGDPRTTYPEPDSRPPLGAFQPIQYLLDNCSTVAQAIASFENFRMLRAKADSPLPPSHWLVGDSRGNCASIEFIEGKMVSHSGWKMPVKALANSTYDHSMAYYWQYRFRKLFSPIPIPDADRSSLLRFAVAGEGVKKYRSRLSVPAVDYAFQLLTDVEVTPSNHTAIYAWVYDSSNKRICFRSWNNDKIRWFDLNSFDFSCTTPVKVLDTRADLSGDVSNSFVNHTKEVDLEMLNSWLEQGIIPPQAVIDFSSYPDTTVCTE